MSSMSVVDSIQLVDVNKKTQPQDNSINKHQGDIDFSPELNEEIKWSAFQNSPNVTYSDLSDNQTVQSPINTGTINSSSLTDEDSNKIEQLKGFAAYFIPIYTFFKDVTPKFTVPDVLRFDFTPLTNFFDALLSSVSDTCVSIYDIGKNVINTSVEFIKDIGGSAFDTSIDFGKSVISTITGFYDSLTSSSDDSTEIKSNNIVSDNPSPVRTKEQIENKDLKKPYWYTLNGIDDNNFQISPGRKFQGHFDKLRGTTKLDNDFLIEGKNSILQVNGQQISKHSPESMLHDLKQVLPNLESRQLVSSYLTNDLFSQPYVKLLTAHPEFTDLTLQDVKVSYVVDELNDGRFQLVATSKSNLNSSYKVGDNTYDSFGAQVSTILSKDKAPNIEYAYFFM
jgi:hypothetical protein